MKKFLILMVLSMAAYFPAAYALDKPAAAPAEKPMAVLVYADWCFNCKMLLPRLEPLKKSYSDRIDFHRLDVTNEKRKKGAQQTARELGILDLYYANKSTGLVILVNKNHEKVGELRYTLTDEEMKEKLDALLES